jgi:hypothetical protein
MNTKGIKPFPSKTEILTFEYLHGALPQEGDYVVFTHSPHIFDDDDLNCGVVVATDYPTILIEARDGMILEFKGREWEVNGENYKWSHSVFRP